MKRNLIAKATVTIAASKDDVWHALVTPAAIKQYMFGADVRSEWKEGSPIVWSGEWQGKSYEDKGVIIRVDHGRRLQYTHFSPLSGLPDVPENYHTVTVELADAPPGTLVTLTQDHNATEEAREHSEKNWAMMLAGLKRTLEA
ncbi:MAG: SRPBCC domain-containing protein [Gemmatimonadaceae bacterium]